MPIVALQWADIIKSVPIISSFIVILTFIISQLISHYSRKIEARRAWYYKAYLEKSVDKVNTFFSDSKDIIKDAINVAQAKQIEEEKQNYITACLELISDKQREFVFQTLYSFKGAYPKIFRDINLILNNYYDIHSKVFDVNDPNLDNYQQYLEDIGKVKNNLMTLLAIPVLNNKQSRRLKRDLAELNPKTKNHLQTKLVLGLLLIALSPQFCRYSNQKSEQEIGEAVKYDVFTKTHSIIDKKLKSPSTAIYSSYTKESVNQLNDTIFVVNGYVDSQNIYAAMIRQYYSCTIIYFANTKEFRCKATKLD